MGTAATGGRVFLFGGVCIDMNSFGGKGALFMYMVTAFATEGHIWASKVANARSGRKTGRPYGCHRLSDSTRMTMSFIMGGGWEFCLEV